MNLNEAFECYRSAPTNDGMEMLYPLVRDKVKSVLRWSLKRFGEPEEGLVVSTTTDVLMDLDKFAGDSLFSTWVERVVRRDAVDSVRKQLRAPFQLFDPSAADFGKSMSFQGDQINSLMLADIFQQLDDEEKKLLSGKMEGLDGAELTEILGVPHGTVRWRWSELKKKISNILGVSDAQRIESETPSTSLQVL